jgi:hypothetical protein
MRRDVAGAMRVMIRGTGGFERREVQVFGDFDGKMIGVALELVRPSLQI